VRLLRVLAPPVVSSVEGGGGSRAARSGFWRCRPSWSRRVVRPAVLEVVLLPLCGAPPNMVLAEPRHRCGMPPRGVVVLVRVDELTISGCQVERKGLNENIRPLQMKRGY
jgi:hypothetical protein